MSQFNGVFANLPGVSCDRFTGINLNADQFFLSHCHADHMLGLDLLIPTLRRRNAVKVNHRIYCSSISKTFLVKKFKAIDERHIKELAQNEPLVLNIFDKAKKDMYKLKVTAIPADHCPGSVMFLFETGEDQTKKNILYTGDFRWENYSFEGIQALHDSEGNTIPIHEMYLDTTFCSLNYKEFPTRLEAIQRIWEIVHSWIRKNGMYRRKRAKHVVLFHLPAQFGSEAILKYIYEQSSNKWKIHVSQGKFNEYLCIEDLGECTSSNSDEAQWIHACSWNKSFSGSKSINDRIESSSTIPCQEGPFEVCQIRPSAMYFKTSRLERTEDKVVKCVGGQSYRVCYSSHSSLTELQDFVNYFKPNLIFPCALPKGMTHQDVLKLLSSDITGNYYISNSDPETNHSQPNNDNEISNLTNKPGMSDVGCYVPECKPNETLMQDSQSLLDNSTSIITSKKDDPVKYTNHERKRKLSIYISPAHKSKTICDNNDNESSDDDEGNKTANKKRKIFQQTSKRSGACSMPTSLFPDMEWQNKNVHLYNNRASLPHNLKIPEIRIIPSSPSLDPNDPDYPEFYEGKLYIESKNSSSSSSEINKSEDIRTINSPKNHTSTATKDSRFNNDNNNDKRFEEKTDKEDEILYNNANIPLDNHSTKSEEEEDTPELEFVLANVNNDTERQNCIKFAERELKRKLSAHNETEEENTQCLEIVMARANSEEERQNCINFASKCLKRNLSDH